MGLSNKDRRLSFWKMVNESAMSLHYDRPTLVEALSYRVKTGAYKLEQNLTAVVHMKVT